MDLKKSIFFLKIHFNIALSCLCLLMSSCSNDRDRPNPTPPDYPIDDFIFNTYLFEPGSWWVLYDSSTQDYDTISVTSGYGQHQNVFEGNKLAYTNYLYRGTWHESNSDYEYRIEYNSRWSYLIKNRQVQRINISGLQSSFDALFFSNMEIKDSLLGGFIQHNSTDIVSYFRLNSKSDSCLVMGNWQVNPCVTYSILNSTVFDFKDIEFTFQEHTGIISHTIKGNYRLVDKFIIPMIK